MIKKALTVAIAAMVCILMVTAVLVPVIGSSVSTPMIYRNSGSFFNLVDDTGEAHTIVVSAGTNGFVITCDGEECKLPPMATYNPGGVRVADAIAIGVYEAYNDNGVLTSQAGVTPTASQTIDTFRNQALAGNTDDYYGTYQLWNYYQYILYKMMGMTVMGNTDSQYMMGPGKSAGSGPNTTGLTSSAYTVSATNNDSVCLFIENAYGSLWDFVGDTQTINYVLKAGNTLGGQTIANVKNTLTGTYTIPTVEGSAYWIASTYGDPDAWGTPKMLTATAGEGGDAINDRLWSNSGSRLLGVGGSWSDGASAGLSAWSSYYTFSDSRQNIGVRLAYVIPDASPASALTTYGYKITYDADTGTISNVQALVDGVLTAKMPTGTTLNDFWAFDTETGVGPFGSYYVAINMAGGDNADDETEERLSKTKGEVAYILDPTDFTKTLAGQSYTSGLYNIMLMIPRVYWGTDADGNLYISNSATAFDGVTMMPYAHTYTLDPSVDTKNPMTAASASLAIGEDSIVRLFDTGDVYVIKTNAMVKIGQITADDDVTFTITDSTLGYTIGTTDYTVAKYQAYVCHEGDYVYARNPFVVPDTDIIIVGGYAYDLSVVDGETINDIVDIGYCASGVLDESSDDYISLTAVLYPVSNAGYTVTDTDITVNLSKVRSDLYKVNDVSFITAWDSSGTDEGNSTAVYNTFLVPHYIFYTEASYQAFLGIIPVLMIAAIVLMVIALMITGKMDD